MSQTKYPSKAEFAKVSKELFTSLGTPNVLTFEHVGRVFGPEFYMLLVEALLDSQDAARAIQGAVRRLKDGEYYPEDPVKEVQDAQ